MYYEISETSARRAKEANSFYDYKPGSATSEYRSMVDEAKKIAEAHKKRVDPMHHEYIDYLVEKYARKLAANMNKENEIRARVPSVMIAGPSNFPVRAKEKQNAASRKNMEEWRYIQGLLDKIRSVGMGGISADDPRALDKLEEKLAETIDEHTMMKAANEYWRKHKTLEGLDILSDDAIAKINARMTQHKYRQPYMTYHLAYALREKKRIEDRIKAITRMREKPPEGWEFDGGKVVVNTEANRLQVFFDEIPDEAVRTEMKGRAFKWARSVGAWQRQLTNNAIYDAKHIKAIQPQESE